MIANAPDPGVIVRMRPMGATATKPRRLVTGTVSTGVYETTETDASRHLPTERESALRDWVTRNVPPGAAGAKTTYVTAETNGDTYYRVEWIDDDTRHSDTRIDPAAAEHRPGIPDDTHALWNRTEENLQTARSLISRLLARTTGPANAVLENARTRLDETSTELWTARTEASRNTRNHEAS